MKLKQADTVLLKMLYAVAACIVITQVLGIDNVTSILFFLTFPLTVFLWLRAVRKTLTSMDIVVLAVIVLAIVSVLLNALFTETQISFSYVKKLIMFIMSILFLQTAHKICVGTDMIRFINRIVDVVTVFLIAMYFLRTPQMHVLNGRVTSYLTFGFTNPNLAGLFLVCLYMLTLYRLFLPEKVWAKVFHIVLAVFLAWFVFACQSRNSLLVMVLYTAVCAWLIFRGRRNMRIGKFSATAIAIFPAVFALLYVSLISSDWIHQVFGFLVEEGKELDSRTRIWMSALNHVAQSPIIGAYSQISGGTGTGHMHNTHLDMVASYGIPVMVLMCVLLQKYLHQDGKIYTNKNDFIYILGFACSIMLGIGEAALFSGGIGIYVFIGAFLMMTNYTEKQTRDG